MGITVVSATASVATSETAASGGSTSGGLDFAALLTQQLVSGKVLANASLAAGQKPGNTQELAADATLGLPGTTASDKNPGTGQDQLADLSLTPDAAMTAALAAGYLPPPSTPPSAQTNASDSGTQGIDANGKNTDGGILSLLSGRHSTDDKANDGLIGKHVTGGSASLVATQTTSLATETSKTGPTENSANQSFSSLMENLKSQGVSQNGIAAEHPGKTPEIIADTAKSANATAGDPVTPSTAPNTSLTQGAHHADEASSTALQVRAPLQDPRWSQEFGEKIVWAAHNDLHTAQININPPQLGPVQITLSMNGDQLSASFVSAHNEVRQAIEDSLPRLKEIFSGAGINLGDANVGTQQQQAGGDKAPQFSGSGRESSRFTDDNAILRTIDHQITPPVPAAVQRGRGLVDLFA
jgi:flagellar hook-length control protein FliK